MTPETFLEKFDQLADAPNSSEKMRELVLKEAVCGHLVSQEPDDEPAYALLERAKREREVLIDEGRIKRPRVIRAGSDFEAEGPLPASWEWTTLAALSLINPRNVAIDDTPATFISMSGVPRRYRGELAGETRTWADLKRQFTHFADGDVALAKITPCFQNGKSVVLHSLENGIGAGSTELHVARPLGQAVLPEYVWIFLKSPRFLSQGVPVMTGSAGQKRVPAWYFALKPFPLPPLAEQKRIVAKVDKLMALCDRLEAQQQERETQHAALARASLARFTDSPTPANLNFLFHKYYTILPADLRKSILTLAVRGRLVPQDPKDQSASEVLNSGAELPEGYVRRRKIMKRAPIQSNEEMFPALPPTWVYSSIQSLYEANLIVDYADGNHGSLYPRKAEFGDSGVTFVTARNLSNGRVSWSECDRLNETRAQKLTKGWAKRGDVLLTHNATVGRVALVEPAAAEFLLGTSVTFYRLHPDFIDPVYFYYVLASPTWQGQLSAIMQQTTRSQVSIQKQAYFRVPIAPIAEQRRIAGKVDEVMVLVDQLETQLADSRDTATNLLEAVVAELTA